jgi:hypothetical protein
VLQFKIMRLFVEFLQDAGGWGVGSVVAAFAFFALGLWEHSQDKSVSAFVFVCLSVPLFWVGAFLAWRKKYKELEKERANVAALSHPADHPTIRISQWDQFQQMEDGFSESGFLLHNEGRTAYEATMEPCTVGRYYIRSAELSTVQGGSLGTGLLPVWVDNVRDVNGGKWDLLGVFELASKERDEPYYGMTANLPEYSVSLRFTYRDHRNLWYRTHQQLTYIPAYREFRFGAARYEPLGLMPQ